MTETRSADSAEGSSEVCGTTDLGRLMLVDVTGTMFVLLFTLVQASRSPVL